MQLYIMAYYTIDLR